MACTQCSAPIEVIARRARQKETLLNASKEAEKMELALAHELWTAFRMVTAQDSSEQDKPRIVSRFPAAVGNLFGRLVV